MNMNIKVIEKKYSEITKSDLKMMLYEISHNLCTYYRFTKEQMSTEEAVNFIKKYTESPNSLKYVCRLLPRIYLNSPEFILQMIGKKESKMDNFPEIVEYATSAVKNDKNVITEIITQYGGYGMNLLMTGLTMKPDNELKHCSPDHKKEVKSSENNISVYPKNFEDVEFMNGIINKIKSEETRLLILVRLSESTNIEQGKFSDEVFEKRVHHVVKKPNVVNKPNPEDGKTDSNSDELMP